MIFITGAGIVTAIGNGIAENLRSLVAEKSGIRKAKDIPYLRKDFLVGQVPLSNDELLSQLGIKRNGHVPRSALLAIKSIQEMTTLLPSRSSLKTGIVFSTSVGGMDLTEQFYQVYRSQNDISNMDVLSTHDNGALTEIIADYLGIKEQLYTLSTACSSSANAIMLGGRLINAGIIDRVFVGGADALTNFTLNGFDSLMIYDEEICKPFDDNRRGLNLGEGAGFLLLENEKSLIETNNEVIGRVLGWANTNDAYHQTASSPEGKGATLAIQKALEMAQMRPTDVDYINAHGTATPNNDLSESKALINVFAEEVPGFSSTKGFTGHTLAASGVIESIYSLLAIRENTGFVNLNYQTPLKETSLTPITEQSKSTINTVLTNSFGFAGNCSSLIFSA